MLEVHVVEADDGGLGEGEPHQRQPDQLPADAGHLGDADLERFAVDSFSETDYAGVGFGLGFSVRLDRRVNKSLASEGTFGWGGAASTVFWVDPAEELSVCFFTQLLPSGTYPIRRELEQLVYQSLVD